MAKVEKTVILNVDSKKATRGLKDLEKGIDGVNKEVKETAASTEAIGGTLDQVTGGAVTKFTNFKKTLKGVTGGFKTMRLAIISTGLGALVVIIGSLIAAFKGSEEGQNKFAKIMTVIGALTGNLVDLLADLGEGIINAFTNPIETLKGFSNSIKTYVMDKINATIDGIGLFGDAIKKVFSGDFKGALKDASDGFVKMASASPLGMLKDGVDALTKSTKEFVKEQINEASAAAKVADMRAKADKIERDLIVERSKLESEIAQLRLKSRQEEQFSAEERKQALLDAQKLEDTLLDKETEFLELRRDAQIQENTFSRSNKENLTKEAEAIAAVNRQVAARANAARQVQREVNTISKQIAAEEKASIKELSDLKKTLRDAEAVSEQEKRELELIKIQEHYDNLIAQANENNIKTDELEAARDEAKRLKQEEFDVKDAERKQKKLEDDKKIADSEIALEQQKTAAKRKALDDAISLAGAETGVGKALLIVKQGLALKEMIMEAKKTITFSKLAVAKSTVAAAEGTAQTAKIGFPQNIPMLIGYAAQAVGIIGAIRSATSSANSISGSFGGGGGASVPAAPPSVPTASSIPPSFNVVGASETSVLGDAVASQTNEPIQAYVVSNDVTTAQSLENNIVEGATL